MKTYLMAIAATAMLALPATATTIGFDDPDDRGFLGSEREYRDSGIRYSADGYAFIGENEVLSVNSTSRVEFTQGGDAFKFVSIDLRNLADFAQSVTLTGYFDVFGDTAIETYQQIVGAEEFSLLLPLSFDDERLLVTFPATEGALKDAVLNRLVLTVSGESTSLDDFDEQQFFSTALTITDAPSGGDATVEVDNVVLSAVPLPAPILFLGSGLLGFAALRRRQKATA